MNNKTLVGKVITTIGGTTIALLIPFLATPLLSRLYTPSDFGHLAVYLSIISIGAIVATCRYELAIIIPRRKIYAVYLVMASLLLAALFSFLTCIFNLSVWLINPDLVENFLSPSLFVVLVPLGIFILSATQIFTYWQIRQENYGTIAKARIAQSTMTAATQITLGLLSPLGFQLIIGHILGGVISLIYIARNNARYIYGNLKDLRFFKLKVLMARFSDMPKYLVLGHLANILSSQMPVILLAVVYGQKYAGFYAMAERLVVLPVAILSSSVGEVFRSSSAIEYHKSGSCLELFLKVKARLLVVGISAATVIYFLAPYAFTFVLGESWRQSGEVAVILSLLVLFQSISSPLSQTVYLASMYRLDLIWQLFRLIGSIIAIYIGRWLYDDFLVSVQLYVLVLTLAYIVHSYMQYVAARGIIRQEF